MLPHVVPERRAEILRTVESSRLPEGIKNAARSGDSSEEIRAGRVVLSQMGASSPDVEARCRGLLGLLRGVTERPMGRGELELVTPWIDARMRWAVVDGELLLGRDDSEVGQLTAGLNLSKSSGLTRHGADMVRKMTVPVLEAWIASRVDGFGADTRYIAALFGARESVEASVVIFSVLAAIGLAGSGRVPWSRLAAGVGVAVLLSLATGKMWNSLIKAGTLLGGRETIFIAFGVASIAMFLLIGSAIFHPVYFGGWMSKLREIGRKNAAWAGFLVAFLAVYREGFEMSLSMTTLSMMGGWGSVWSGLGIGLPAGLLMVAAGWRIHRGWIGVRGMLIASGAMMVLAASSFAALFVNYLEQHGTIVPFYLHKNVPVAVTVLTGLSGSLQTLAAFLGTAFLLIGPWAFLRIRHLIQGPGGKVQPMAAGAETAMVTLRSGGIGAVVALLAGAAVGHGTAGTSAVSWEEAKQSAATSIVVDGRAAGSSPALDNSTSLPPDNDDDSIRQFCDFAGGKKIIVYGTGKSGKAMAERISKICGRDTEYIKEGNDPWASKK